LPEQLECAAANAIRYQIIGRLGRASAVLFNRSPVSTTAASKLSWRARALDDREDRSRQCEIVFIHDALARLGDRFYAVGALRTFAGEKSKYFVLQSAPKLGMPL
jgi:hypothetical protein